MAGGESCLAEIDKITDKFKSYNSFIKQLFNIVVQSMLPYDRRCRTVDTLCIIRMSNQGNEGL